MFMKTTWVRLVAAGALTCSGVASAATYTGLVTMLEIWQSGNVAFILAGAAPCNGQFIINVSSPGTKNMYAALLAAKQAGKPIRVSQTICGAAEGYGGSYALVDYLYPED
jgi:hypothetical protein